MGQEFVAINITVTVDNQAAQNIEDLRPDVQSNRFAG